MADALDLMNTGFVPATLSAVHDLPELVFTYWAAMRRGHADRERVELAESQNRNLANEVTADPYLRELARVIHEERAKRELSIGAPPKGRAWGEIGGVQVG